MSKRGFTRRRLLQGSAIGTALAGAGAFFGPWTHNRAYAQGKPIKLGLTCDASGQYGNSGQDDLRGIKIAIKEFNAKGGVLGRKIECDHRRHRNQPGDRHAHRRALHPRGRLVPDRGAALRRRERHHPGRAEVRHDLPQHQLLGSPTEAGENCHRVKFVWDGNGTNFAQAAVKKRRQGHRQELAAADQRLRLGPHHLEGDADRSSRRTAASVVDDLLVPQNTRDFTSYLLKIQQIKPDVVAAAVGGDDIKALRAAGRPAQARRQAGLDQQPAGLAGRLGLGPRASSACSAPTGTTSSTLPGVKEFVATWKKMAGAGAIQVPGNVSYNGYMATRELLRAIERAGIGQQHQDHQGARGPQDAGAPTACRTSTPISTRTPIRCSRRSIWRAATRSRRTRPTITRSSPGRRPRKLSTRPRRRSASSCPTSRCRRGCELPDDAARRAIRSESALVAG